MVRIIQNGDVTKPLILNNMICTVVLIRLARDEAKLTECPSNDLICKVSKAQGKMSYLTY